MNNTAKVIASFAWGYVSINTAKGIMWVVRESGYMNKADVINAIKAEGYRVTSAGHDPRIPYMRARQYEITAA
jgi:allophanate hydrolase subunit 1